VDPSTENASIDENVDLLAETHFEPKKNDLVKGNERFSFRSPGNRPILLLADSLEENKDERDNHIMIHVEKFLATGSSKVDDSKEDGKLEEKSNEVAASN